MDPQQLSILLGPDLTPFQTLIAQLMSTANDQRSAAVSAFNLVATHHPETLTLNLSHLLASSPPPNIRAMAAVLLRKLLTQSSDSYFYPRLSHQAQSQLKSILLSSIEQEEVKSISKKLCDTISELASNLLPEDSWPELLPFMFQAVNSDLARLQESALLIFSRLAQYIGDILLPRVLTLHDLFLRSLMGASADVRVAALGAAINFIQYLSASDRDRFQDLLPVMMRMLTESLNTGNEMMAQEALELLIELGGSEPRFLRRQIQEVIGEMLQIAETDGLEEGTRRLAVEFVITLAEARERAPGMMRNLPQFVGRLFGVLMKMLLDIEDVLEWHAAVEESDDAGEMSNYSVGQECLDRLSIALGGNTIVPVASELFSAYLAAPEWHKHHAALTTLAQIAEGCSKVMIKNLEQVVNMVWNSFQDPHPRVRWAAINAIG